MCVPGRIGVNCRVTAMVARLGTRLHSRHELRTSRGTGPPAVKPLAFLWTSTLRLLHFALRRSVHLCTTCSMAGRLASHSYNTSIYYGKSKVLSRNLEKEVDACSAIALAEPEDRFVSTAQIIAASPYVGAHGRLHGSPPEGFVERSNSKSILRRSSW